MKTIKSSSGGCGSQPTPPDTRKPGAHTSGSALKTTLLEVAAELEELKRAVGGSLTGWRRRASFPALSTLPWGCRAD